MYRLLPKEVKNRLNTPIIAYFLYIPVARLVVVVTSTEVNAIKHLTY
jgi:hypothetical protein